MPARCRRPFPASPMLSTLPNSHRTFHNVRIRGGRQHLAPAFYPPAVHALRSMERGRIRGLGHERVARVDIAVALAPLPVRGQEVESVGSGHRSRRSLLVAAHAVNGRGLWTATALGVEALGRVVTALDPRIVRERSRSDRYCSRRQRTRSPACRGERRDRSRSTALSSRSHDRSRSGARLPDSPARL